MPNLDKKQTAWIVGSIFALGEVIFLGFGISDLYHQYTILHWPSADAVVTYWGILSTEGRSGRHDTLTVTYWLNLELRYTVNGREYLTPSKIGDSDQLEIAKEAGSYKRGTHHRIHYNPIDPGKIRMEVDYDFTVPIILGVFALIIAGVAVFFVRLTLH